MCIRLQDQCEYLRNRIERGEFVQEINEFNYGFVENFRVYNKYNKVERMAEEKPVKVGDTIEFKLLYNYLGACQSCDWTAEFDVIDVVSGNRINNNAYFVEHEDAYVVIERMTDGIILDHPYVENGEQYYFDILDSTKIYVRVLEKSK